ncbi:MAG: hypothetical protein PWP07_99 [Epulopiscium sp.]|nr:hypothetical protein [Candidatus Epulonipiscium sp.]
MTLGGEHINHRLIDTDAKKLEKGQIWLDIAKEGANDGFWGLDIPQNTIYYNGKIREYFDGDKSTLYMPIEFLKEIIHPMDIDYVNETLKRYLKREISIFKTECRVAIQPSNYEWVLIQGKGIWDENDEPLYLAGSYTLLKDFTNAVNHHYDIKRQLKETSALLDTIFDSIPDPIYIKDTEDRIIQCNMAALDLWGYTSEEVIGKKCTDLKMCSKPCTESITQKACQSKKTEKIQTYIEKLEKWVEIMAYPVFDKDTNEVQLVMEHIKDITDLKKVELILQENIKCQEKLLKEAQRDNKAKTEYFTNVSHELKTPLNIILSTLQLLETFYLPSEKEKKYASIMKQNCYRLLRLLNNIIDVTKIDSSFFKLHLENADIVYVVKQITLSVEQYIKNKSINLLFESKVSKQIMAFDAEKIERIMLNLLSNAAKFTLPGGVIKVGIEKQDEKILISVKDTGIGIPSQKQHVIFQRFGQVDSSATRQYEGSGIGLFLVKSLVEMHNGTIHVQSEEHKGTEFIIELPIKVLKEKAKEPLNNERSSYKNVEMLNIELSDIYE